MLCKPLAMASVFQSLAAARSSSSSSSSSYGARLPCSSPFHQRPAYLKVRDLHFPPHSNSLIFFSNGQLSLNVVITAEATQQDLQEGAQETVDTVALSNATKSPSLPIRYRHLQNLYLELCEGAEVPSAMDPWLQKLTLSDWNHLLLHCGRKDINIAKQILVLFREKEAVLDQAVLFSKRNEEQALAASTEALNEFSRESDANSSQEIGEDAAETPQEATLQEEQEGLTEQDLETGSFQAEVEQNSRIISPSLKLYTTFARVLTEEKRYDEVDTLEMEVKEAGLEPNVHYYNVLLDSYIQRRTLSNAIELLHHMKSLGFIPHIYIHEKLAFVYFDEENFDVEVLKEFAEDLRSRNSTATPSLYKNLLKVHWATNDVAGAEEAFGALIDAGHTPEMKAW